MPSSRQESFIDRFADIAIEAAKIAGVSPQVVLGQTALETGWGKSVAGGNMFGIKGAGQVVTTKEDYGKGLVSTKESFRAYSNPDDSFADYGRLISGSSRYQGAREKDFPKDQVAAIGKSGYATDRNYGSKLGAIVDRIEESKTFQDRVVNNIASLEPAEPDWTGVLRDEGYRTRYDGAIQPVPSGAVSISELGPLGAPTGFDPSMAGIPGQYGEDQAWGGYTPDYASQPDYANITEGMYGTPVTPDYSDISIGMYGAPAYPGSSLESFTPNEAAAPDFSGAMPQSNFDAIQSEAFPGASFNMDAYAPDPGLSISSIGPAGWGEYAGVTPTDYQGGFSAGFRETTPTPDFNAPSLDQRQQDMISQERVSNFEQGNWARPGSIPQDVINASVMDELAPAPTQVASLGPVAAAPREAVSVPPSTVDERPFDMQGAYLADFEDKLGPRALPAPSVQPITELPALPVTSVAPVRQAPSVAPVQRSVAPVQQAPVRIERAPTLPTATLPQTSLPQSAPTPPERPSGFQGFGDINTAMGAIGAGHAAMPSGYNEAWGKTAFGDSVYAGAAYNDLMDAVSKQGGFADRKGVVSDMPASVKGGALGMLGGPLGMVAGAAFGGLKDAGYMPSFSLGSFFGDMFGQGGYDGPYQGAGREGETYSNERGFSDPGGWGLSVGGDLSGYADGSAYGGPSGGSQGGGGGGFGGYGNADGSVSNDGPGIW